MTRHTYTNTFSPAFDSEAFASAINTKLFECRMKQTDLALMLGMSPSTICRVVKSRKDPDIHNLALLLTWLGRNFEDFVICRT